MDQALAAPLARPPVASPGGRDHVAGLANGLAVIQAFDRERPRLAASEVAARTGLSRAAARRYLLTLAELGFVRQERRLFALTPRVLRLAQSYMDSARLPRIIQPELQRLSRTLGGEASSAGVLDGDDVLCVAATHAGRDISATLQPGTRVPAWCTSNGRVLLAALPAPEFERWLARQAPAPLTAYSISAPDRLAEAIAQVRRDGYAAVDREFEAELRTVAVPLSDFRGDTVAAINVSVHAARMGMGELLERALPRLRQAQALLSRLL